MTCSYGLCPQAALHRDASRNSATNARRGILKDMLTILILEEDDLIRGLLKEWLLGAGYQVQLGDPRRAPSTRPAHDKVGLIIANICMPKDQGAEGIRQLKLAYPGASIIAISARFCSSLGGSAEGARQLGVRKVLSKPFTREELLDAVRSVMGAPAAAREE
jgi:CheY-like chemotaxis protein